MAADLRFWQKEIVTQWLTLASDELLGYSSASAPAARFVDAACFDCGYPVGNVTRKGN
jgi:hypothetical protein